MGVIPLFHQLPVRLGIATLNLLKEEPVYEKLESLGKHFEEYLKNSSVPFARAQRVGSIVWLYLDKGAFPRRHDTISELAVERFKNIYWKLLEDGFYLPPSAYEVMFISFAHTPEEIEGLARSIVKNLRSIP